MDTDNLARSDIIHGKGFNISNRSTLYRTADSQTFRKIKVGVQTLDDAVLDLGSFKGLYPHGTTKAAQKRMVTKQDVLRAIVERDLPAQRRISNLFYEVSGIYERVCNYFAYLYRYDWYLYINTENPLEDLTSDRKIIINFSKLLNYLDNSYIRKMCGDIAASIMRNGCYYGYIVEQKNALTLQELPPNYCRSRYNVNGLPAIEFDMRFFDLFADPQYRVRVLKLFPEEFQKGYVLYKKGKLLPDVMGDNSGSWYLLSPELSVKFNFNGNDTPPFISSIPAILDLDAAQDLDRRKQMQKLLKIIVQKLPMDKNGDLIFDIDEARDIHNNAVAMLSRAIGVDVLTTFTDVESIDLSDKNTTTSTDDLEKVERTVFNNLGISQNLFNTDGQTALEKSILNDEATVRNLLLQFNMFFDRVVKLKLKNKKYDFKFYMLETTQYNYKELSKLYKEQTQVGFSKILPQIALGHSQNFIWNTAVFENEVLHLSEIMIPPLMSSTMSSEDVLGNRSSNNQNNSQNKTANKQQVSNGESGRPEKPDDEKSAKTLQNKESMS